MCSHAMKIINFKKKKMKLLAKKQQESFESSKVCYICQEKFESKYFLLRQWYPI